MTLTSGAQPDPMIDIGENVALNSNIQWPKLRLQNKPMISDKEHIVALIVLRTDAKSQFFH